MESGVALEAANKLCHGIVHMTGGRRSFILLCDKLISEVNYSYLTIVCSVLWVCQQTGTLSF